MASSPRSLVAILFLIVLGTLSRALVGANQSHLAEVDGIYAVAVSETGSHGRISPSAPSKRTVLAVTNVDRNSPATITLTPTNSHSRPLATLTSLRVSNPLPCGLLSEKPVDEPLKPPEPAATRDFTVHCGNGPFNDERFFSSVTTQLIGHSAKLAVYLHPSASRPTPDRVQELLSTFDAMQQRVAGLLRETTRDIDGNGRFCVLLVPQPTPPLPIAFVRPADFSPSTNARLSNQADLMYLSCRFPTEPLLGSLISHEYTHALCCSLRPEAIEDDWLHEAIAHSVEQLVGGSAANFDHRLSRYLQHTHRYPLIVPDYFAAGLYREHGCRGATLSFLETARRNHGDVNVLRDLVTSRSTGVPNVVDACDTQLPGLLRDWTAGMLQSVVTPRVVGDFVMLGPSLTKFTGDQAISLTVAPTATAYINVSTVRVPFDLQSTGQIAPQATLYVSKPTQPLVIHARIESDQLMADIELPTTRDASQLVVGVETHGLRQSKSLGTRFIPNPSRMANVELPVGSTQEPITIKAFARFPDGSFVRGQLTIQRIHTRELATVNGPKRL